jgi:large subunit ribosomal protein L13
MSKSKRNKTHEVDATNRAVGRVATEVAMILRGKNSPDFAPNIDSGNFVRVKNASKVKFTGNKLVQKDYYHHTMYPGGLRRTSMKKVFDKDPTLVLRKAVIGMLPKNKLRNEMMKRLTIQA